MKRKLNYIETRNPEKVVSEKFSASYMNNTKWNKLMEALTDGLDHVYLKYKLIYSEKVKGCLFDMADYKSFFLEPILYKEIEWIEIPISFEDWVNENNRKAGKRFYTQNLEKAIIEIHRIGEFELDLDEESIRIYGYK